MAHGDEREGKWRGNWRMEWVVSTLHTTSEHDVSNIITANAHTSAASSRLNWRHPADLNGLVLYAERRNLFSPRVPSHFRRSLVQSDIHFPTFDAQTAIKFYVLSGLTKMRNSCSNYVTDMSHTTNCVVTLSYYLLCICTGWSTWPSMLSVGQWSLRLAFRRKLCYNVVCFLLGNSPATEFYIPTFRSTLFHLRRLLGVEQSVPKRRHIKFRRRGITQKKAYNFQKKKTAKVWNQ